jgi:hypothetical protein
MTITAEAPATPDLSYLTPRQRMNIAVAETQGAIWRWHPSVGWRLYKSGVCNFQASRWNTVSGWLPDYAGDPAAWGALMEKEGVWPQPVYSVDGILKGWHGHHRMYPFQGAYPGLFSTIGEAICAVVLHRHGIYPAPYIGEASDE